MICRILFLLVCWSGMAFAAEPVGLLSMVSGEVQIVRAGQAAPVAARTADLIAAGDRVLTGRGSEAMFLFCPESRAAKMTADSEVEFAAASLAVRQGKLADERKVPTCRLPSSLALAGSSRMQSGMMRLRGSNILLRSPSHTNIAALQPNFRWDPVENATAYELKLLDREEKVLWRHSGPATEAPLPADAFALDWGQKYWWRVTAREGDETLTEAGSFFQVLPREQAEHVHAAEATLLSLRQDDPADNGPLFLLAFLYEDNGMLDQAVRVYGELTPRMSSQDWLQGRINDLLGKLGWDRLESGPPR